MEAAAEEEQDGLSVHSPGQAPPSSASSLPKEHSQVDLELRILDALEIYPPSKLKGVHRHFVLYGLMEFLQRSFDRHFSADEILQLLDRFFNLEMLFSSCGVQGGCLTILYDRTIFSSTELENGYFFIQSFA